MKLPGKHTNTVSLPAIDTISGQVLRLMLDGKRRTKLQITEALRVHPAREVTARLRDFRKAPPEGYNLDIPKTTERVADQTLYYYQIILNGRAEPLLEALRKERNRVVQGEAA